MSDSASARSRRFRPPSALALLVWALFAHLAAAPGGAQFTLWDSFPVTNPFSVTAAARGVAPAPSVKLEAIVGFFNGSMNQFVFHSSGALPATQPSAGLRHLNTSLAIDFTDFGVQSVFNGLCCSNHGRGLTDDTSLHTATNFSTGVSSEILIGIPQLTDPEDPYDGGGDDAVPAFADDMVLGDDDDDSWDDDDDDDDDDDFAPPGSLGAEAVAGTISFRRFYAGSKFPEAGIRVVSIDGAPGATPILRADLTDCQGVSSNWHFARSGSDALDETYVACVKTNGNSVIKRVNLTTFAQGEIPLVSAVGTTSSIFAYLHVAACPISTGTVIGTVIPRASLGNTTFLATFLSGAGAVVGTSQVTLPGARANHQAFYCLSRGDFATFVYHGTGQSPTTTTDTFVVEAGEASLVPPAGGGTPLLVRRVTENRRTDSADDFIRTLRDPGGAKTVLAYRGLDPVAEIQAGTGSQVRYGGIRVPIFFHNFESGDFRYLSAAVP